MSDPAHNGNGSGTVPLVSVVIASVNGLPSIAECVDALVHQEGNVPYEVLVVDCCGDETRSELRRSFPQPQVHLIPVAGRPSIPKLRAVGMARARGRMIAILEDHCNAVPRWIRVIARAHEAGHQAIGGAVANGAVDRAVDWAVFFCEYARFMPPIPRGTVAEITGNNSVYDRRVLDRLGPELGDEVWESFLHERMRALDVPFYSEPDLLVSHKKEFGYGYFMSQRYHYSRSFAGMRLADAPIWKRLAYASLTPMLPALLLLRIVKTVLLKGGHGKRLMVATPAMLTLLVSWAWGEASGALFGPGTRLERVE